MRIRLADQDFFDLIRADGASWSLREGDAFYERIEDTEVRRLLAEVTSLDANRQEEQAAILGLNEREHSITFYLAQGGAEVDRIVVSIGKQVGDERVLSVHREGLEPAAWGRMWVDASRVESLIAPARRYLPLQGIPANE